MRIGRHTGFAVIIFIALAGPLLILAAAILASLAGCTATPEPQIITKTVNIEVPVPCDPKLTPRPALMTKDQIKAALDAAPNVDSRVGIVTEQLLLYLGWVPVLEAGLNGCKGG